MANRETKGRQIELAIGELAGVLANPAAGSARAWLSWSQSGGFGYRHEHWEKLAESVGKHLAKAGWPEANSAPMVEFLAWARLRRGSNMSDFYEGGFLREALWAGAAAGPDLSGALRWASRMEIERKAHVASLPPRSLTDRERSESYERLRLPALRLPFESWAKAVASSPWAAKALFDSAALSFAEEFAANKPAQEQSRQGAVAAAQSIPKEDLNLALRGLFQTYDRAERKKEARAMLASDLAGLGADWLAKTPHLRTGRAESAVDLLIEEGNAFAAKAALNDLGPERFWPAFEAAAEIHLSSSRNALAMSRWIGELGPGVKNTARLVLRAVSTATQDRDSATIKEAFEAIGSMADLKGMSPWRFNGFTHSDELSGWDARHRSGPGALGLVASDGPVAWLSRNRHGASDIGRGEATALGELISQLRRYGVEPPWKSDERELSRLPNGLRAVIESWDINASLETEAPESKRPTVRV